MSAKIKGVRSRLLKIPLTLYHLSFNGGLVGVWDPEFNQKPDENHPETIDLDKVPFYPEPNIPRISVAPTIEGCFRGVYPNVYRYFEEKNYPHMDFFVYSPAFEGSERIVTPDILTSHHLVWDACITNEYLILDKVKMVLVGKVRIQNTNKEPTLKIYPFGDKKLEKESVGPETIKVSWLSGPVE